MKSNITQLVDRLEADGLVEVQQETGQRLLKKLSATESRTLANLLAKVAER